MGPFPPPQRRGLFPPSGRDPRLFRGPWGIQQPQPPTRGFLSQLFQRNPIPPQSPLHMFSRTIMQQPSLLQELTNPQTISNFLGKTQNFLNTIQQLGPLVQQYGPIIKNLPAMWKIYQTLQSGSNETEENSNPLDSEESNVSESSSNAIFLESQDELKKESSPKVQKKKKKRKTGESVPKLYI